MKVRKHQSGRGSTSLEPVYKHASIHFSQNLGCTTGGVHISKYRRVNGAVCKTWQSVCEVAYRTRLPRSARKPLPALLLWYLLRDRNNWSVFYYSLRKVVPNQNLLDDGSAIISR